MLSPNTRKARRTERRRVRPHGATAGSAVMNADAGQDIIIKIIIIIIITRTTTTMTLAITMVLVVMATDVDVTMLELDALFIVLLEMDAQLLIVRV